jgi:hypothetical protein
MAAEQLQIDDFTYRIQRVFMLGNAHRPGANNTPGALPDGGGVT